MQSRILDLWFKADHAYKDDTDIGKQLFSRNSRFFELMRLDRFKQLGKGMYSSVWAKDDRVFKINSNISGPLDGFYHWMMACIQNPDNPCLPKFNGLDQRGDRYCVELNHMEHTGDVQRSKDLVEIAKANPFMMEAVEMALKLAVINKVTYMDDTLLDRVGKFLDIHDENIMVLNGHYVLNDPISTIINFPIPVV